MLKSTDPTKGNRCGAAGGAHHVDSGYHIVCTKRFDAPDISRAKD